MKNLPKFDEFLGESMYDKRWPHWMRFDKIKETGDSVVNYGFMKVGNIDTEKKFFEFLRETGIKYKQTGVCTLEMSSQMADKLQDSVKPKNHEAH